METFNFFRQSDFCAILSIVFFYLWKRKFFLLRSMWYSTNSLSRHVFMNITLNMLLSKVKVSARLLDIVRTYLNFLSGCYLQPTRSTTFCWYLSWPTFTFLTNHFALKWAIMIHTVFYIDSTLINRNYTKKRRNFFLSFRFIRPQLFQLIAWDKFKIPWEVMAKIQQYRQ
jgi:hypothetical protein